MAFPATQTLVDTQQSTLTRQIDRAQQIARTVKSSVQGARDTVQANTPIARRQIIGVMAAANTAALEWAAIGATPGLAQHARDQFADQAFDIVAEFLAMKNAAESLRDWIFAAFPRGAGDAWLVDTYDTAGNSVDLSFSAAQLNGFQTVADAFLATIA